MNIHYYKINCLILQSTCNVSNQIYTHSSIPETWFIKFTYEINIQTYKLQRRYNSNINIILLIW